MSVRSVRIGERKTPVFVSAQETIKPLREQIIVRPLDLKLSETIIASWQGRAVRGIVTHVGPGRYPNIHERGERHGKKFHTIRESAYFRPTEVKVGDIVELGGLHLEDGYAFEQILIDGIVHIQCSEQDVAAVHEPDCDCFDCERRQ